MPEQATMSREEMIQELTDLGMNPELLQKIPDDAILADILQAANAEEGDEGEPPPEPPPENHEETPPAQPPGKKPEEYSDDEVRSLPDEQRHEAYMARAHKFFGKRFEEMAKKCMGETSAATGHGVDPVTDAVTKHPTSVTMKYSEKEVAALVARTVSEEVEKALKGKVETSIGQLEKFREQQIASQKKLTVEAFCEAKAKEGKISPAELDEGDPKTAYKSVRQRLLRADSERPVHKFKEKSGREVVLTELDAQMQEIDARKPFSFAEKVKGSKDAPGDGDLEVAKVEQHFESFREDFAKLNTSKEDMVEAFKARRKLVKNLTADQYLNVRGRS